MQPQLIKMKNYLRAQVNALANLEFMKEVNDAWQFFIAQDRMQRQMVKQFLLGLIQRD